MKTRKLFSLLLTLTMVSALVGCACVKSVTVETPDSSTTQNQVTETKDDTKIESDVVQTDKKEAEPAKLTGKINLIDLDDRDASVLRGIKICGMSAGSEEDINGKEKSLDDVRCIFELNEWVEFYPDADADYYLRVWVLEHRDDQDYYNTCSFSDLMPGFAAYCDLHYPVDEDNPDEWCWGDFYLNPDEYQPGYYDFVFTYEGKAIGVLLTRFYNAEELSGRSGSELEALMHE